ncbi:MAG: hypothetical protein JSR33_07230 [Proteobacteria bacterium]|nr:hypothetical protein [Pseudomonadota bacterium]
MFRSRKGNKLKALYYELNCFTLWYRQLAPLEFTKHVLKVLDVFAPATLQAWFKIFLRINEFYQRHN